MIFVTWQTVRDHTLAAQNYRYICQFGKRFVFIVFVPSNTNNICIVCLLLA